MDLSKLNVREAMQRLKENYETEILAEVERDPAALKHIEQLLAQQAPERKVESIHLEAKAGAVVKFVSKRRDGAKLIASEAGAKGGFALLTAWHFAAKGPAYDVAEEIIKSNADDVAEVLKQKEVEAVNASHNASQKAFQERMGEAEVFGEVARFEESFLVTASGDEE